MKILVADARAFAAALITGADEAEKNGETQFDPLKAAQSLDDAARADFERAIAEAKS